VSQTPYMETEVLLALLAEDEGQARQLLADMFPGELVTLERHAVRLAELARIARREALEDR
jgi:hypothetical protein